MAEIAIGQLLTTAAIATAVSAGISVITAEAQDDVFNEGQRSSTIPVLDSREGTPQNIVIGARNRIGGVVIFLPEFTDEEVTESFGGGGLSGSGPETTNTTFNYFADVAFAVAEGEITGITKIFANGNLIWTPAGVINVAGTDIESIDMGIIFFFGGAGRMLLKAPSAGTDLTVVRIGEAITVDGFTTGGNNGTFMVTNVGSLSDGSTFIRCRNSLATNEVAGDAVTIDQIAMPFLNSIANSFNQYPGGLTDVLNPIDTIIEGREEDLGLVDKTPGYKKTAYGVFQGLVLATYGNRIPQLTFEVENTTATVEDAILFFLARVGIPASEVDATDLSGIILKGYALPGPISVINALKPLLLAYDIIVQMRAEKIFFIKRVNADFHVILESDLLLQPEGRYVITDVSDNSISKEVTVTYKDVNNELQQGAESERRVTDDGQENTLNVDIPIVLTSGEARTIANRILYRSWQTRQKIQFMLPPKFLKIQEGDYINLVITDFNQIKLFVNQINIGNNFSIEVLGEIDYGSPPTNLLGEEAVPTDQIIRQPTPLQWATIDHAPLKDGDETESGIYVTASKTDTTSVWTGGNGYISTDDINFDFVQSLPTEGRLGVTTDVLADGVPGYFDIINTVNIESSGVLVSVSEINLLNGLNRAFIGSEIIAFKTATLESDGTYTLSNLLRGLRNTESFTGSHTTTERFVLLTNISLFPIPSSNVSTVGYSKVISNGADLADVSSLSHTYKGGNLVPFSPTHLTVDQESNDDLIYTWTRRTRKFYRLFSQVDAPMVDSVVEKYTIQFLEGAVLKRTVVVTTNSYTYLAADISSDGFVSIDTVIMKIFQHGDSVSGRISQIDWILV